MFSQDEHASGIPFTFSHAQQSFRLLELPPPLLELLSSENPPVLSLKSAISPTSEAAPNPTSDNAVLCTHNQTFHLRQVHSSNSLFLIHPISTYTQDTTDSGTSTSAAGLSVTATCQATLELYTTKASPLPYIKQLLPLYRGSDDENAAPNATNPSPAVQEQVSKRALFSNVPFSEAECEDAWTELCAFELHGGAMAPTTWVLNKVWTAISSAATLQGLKLCSGFQIQELWDVLADDGYPRGLVDAVVRTLSDGVATAEWACLDRDKCVSWVGIVALDSQNHPSTGSPVTQFIKDWKDKLPDEWRSHATLSMLKGLYIQPTHTTILPKDGQSSISAADSVSPKTSMTASNTSAGVRKWHEKFKAARR